MNREKIVFVGLAALLTSGLAYGVYADQYLLKSSQNNFEASAVVSEGIDNATELGVNADATFDFGEVPKNVKVRKNIDLGAEHETLVVVSSEGNISEYLEYEEKVYFSGEEELEVAFEPEEEGYLDGRITVETFQPKRGGGPWFQLKGWL